MPESPPPARTLAAALRAWPDDALGRLLTARPDLAAPAPQDFSQLATRAGARASVLRAVDELTVLELAAVDAMTTLGGVAALTALQARLNASPPAGAEAVRRLRSLALWWGPDEELRAVSALGEVVGTTVSGLGPAVQSLLAAYDSAAIRTLADNLALDCSGERRTDSERIARHLADPAAVGRLLEEVGPAARAILEHLDAAELEGTAGSSDRPVPRAQARTPAEQLVARGLLLARNRESLVLPREVGICLRGGRTTRHRVDELPPLATRRRDQALVDRAAAGAAFGFVRHLEVVLEHWSTAPPAVLRGGGLGMRELRATADLLHVDSPTATLHIEVAAAAGLLAPGAPPAPGASGEPDAAWLPTDAFDGWKAAPVADRWVRLVAAWLDNSRLTGLVGSRDERRKPIPALFPGLERPWLPGTRRTALDQLCALHLGQVLAAGTGAASLAERMRWLRPRRPALRSAAVGWLVDEAALLGVTGLEGASSAGRALLSSEDQEQAAAVLEPLLPQPVDSVLLQADLTAVAPGPLHDDLARGLAAIADVESRGGATVYRFTAGSVRRAFDAGWSADEVHKLLASASRTPVPQPLRYLVDDVARRFGTVRVGAAGTFLRSDDEAALAELVHDPQAASLRLRRIAPTVVVSDAPVDVLLSRLRELGVAPVVEGPDGAVRLAHSQPLRARVPKRRTPVEGAWTPARVAATVTAIRAGERAAAHRPSGPGARPSSPAATLALLRESVSARGSVWLGYVDDTGSARERVVDPVKVEAGWLTAFDHRADGLRAFALSRITVVRKM